MGREEGEYGSAKNQNTVCYLTKNDVAEMRSNKFKKVIGKYNMDYFQGRHFNNIKFPITKVGHEGVMKKNSYFVIYKSFENLSLNNFQVITFETMAKNCFKVNLLSKICQNICFSIKKVIIFYFLYIHDLDLLMIITIYYHYLNFYVTSATCWEKIIFFNC